MKIDYKVGGFFKLKTSGEICIKTTSLPVGGKLTDNDLEYDPNIMCATVVRGGTLWRSGECITIQLSDLPDMESITVENFPK